MSDTDSCESLLNGNDYGSCESLLSGTDYGSCEPLASATDVFFISVLMCVIQFFSVLMISFS